MFEKPRVTVAHLLVWTAAVEGRVRQGDPTGEVLLRLHEGVAVVLMPGEAARLLRALVDGLVPVEVDVGADQVASDRR